MPDDQKTISPAEDDIYGPEYYAGHCGGLEYSRHEPHWVKFFGGIADQIVRSLHPGRVFDAGCAHGFLLEALWDRGVETWGRDISSFAVSEVRSDLRSFVAQGSISNPIDGEYDLVTCIEVLEHMPEAEAVTAITNIAAVASRVLFSSSPTDLDEPTHINVKPVIWWLRRFAEAGMTPVVDYDASFLTPHAYLLERPAALPTASQLGLFAEMVRYRMLASARAAQVGEAERQRHESATRAEAARVDAVAEQSRLQSLATQATERLATAEAALVAARAEAERARGHELHAVTTAAEAAAAGAAAIAEQARLQTLATQAADLVATAQSAASAAKTEAEQARRREARAVAAGAAASAAGAAAIAEQGRLQAAVTQGAESARTAHDALLAATAELQRVQHEMATRDAALAAAEAETARAVVRQERAEAERDWLLDSTSWRATWQLRRLGDRLPESTRRGASRALRMGYWLTTLQLGRLRTARKQRHAETKTVVRKAERPARLPHPVSVQPPSATPPAFDPHPDIMPASHDLALVTPDRLPPATDETQAGGRPVARVALDPVAEPFSVTTETDYDRWVRQYDTLSDQDRIGIRAAIARLTRMPLISVVMPAYETPERLLREAIESVRRQLYPYWELCIADDASPSGNLTHILQEAAAGDPRIKWMRRDENGNIGAATNSALALATGDFVALMDHDDLLPEQALYEIAHELEVNPETDLIYSDEDQIDADGRRSHPYFKPEYNLDLLYGHNFFSHLGVYRRALLERVGGLRERLVDGSQDYDLALRCARVTDKARIRHIPAVLYHWRRMDTASSFSQAQLDRCVSAAQQAIRDDLQARGIAAHVTEAPDAPLWSRVRWPLREPGPLVTVIVPTRDKPELLERCASGILHRTDYDNLELLFVDNDTRDEAALALLARLQKDSRVRVLPHAGPFNYSAMNNAAVREAQGEVVVLLNNDIDVIGRGWLREMVSLAVRSDVGAVGAKLLYGDGRIQHAGVVLGVGSHLGGPGVAGHFGHFEAADTIGHFGQYVLAREVAAVTGACMALRRDVYSAVGGLDEEQLPVSFNDVDLCMRIRASGLRVIWTPFAELYHLESASRGLDRTPDQIERAAREATVMRNRWGAELDADPFYNLNFSRVDHMFRLAFPPRRSKPWSRQAQASGVDHGE